MTATAIRNGSADLTLTANMLTKFVNFSRVVQVMQDLLNLVGSGSGCLTPPHLHSIFSNLRCRIAALSLQNGLEVQGVVE